MRVGFGERLRQIIYGREVIRHQQNKRRIKFLTIREKEVWLRYPVGIYRHTVNKTIV